MLYIITIITPKKIRKRKTDRSLSRLQKSPATPWLFVLAVGLLLASCRGTPGSGDSRFRVNLGTEPPSLDWSLATDHVSFNVIANLMVGLTEVDKNLKT